MHRHPALVSLLLGAVAALGFAPLQLWPLTLACLAVWMWLIHEAPSLRSALSRGYAFGIGHFTINDNWFQHSFDFQDKMPAALGYAAPVALALYIGVYPALAAGLAWRARAWRIEGGYVLAFAAAWIVSEWLRATMFTGYAWDPLGVIWVPVQPVASLTVWIGTYALSGLTIALAGMYFLVSRRRAVAVAGAVIALIGMQALSYRVWATTLAPPANSPRLQVVQPNIPQDQRGRAGAERMLERLITLSGSPGLAPRMLLWPEGVLDDYVEDGYPLWAYGAKNPLSTRLRLAMLLGPRDVLLTGGNALQFDAAGNIVSATNSVFALTSDAIIHARYDKSHLVPYGEYLPMPWLLKPLGLARLVPGSMDFLEGAGPLTVAVPGFGPVGLQICYEIIFSGQVIDRAHRPRLLFNPSNDAWFGRWGPPQHLAQARMRAIEEGLPIVRATPTGISAVIAADGRLIETVAHETTGAIDVPIPEPLPPTLFSRAGNWMAALVALLLLAGAVALRRRAR